MRRQADAGGGLRPQPSHPQCPKLGNRKGFQRFIENTQELRRATSHRKVVGRPLSLNATPNLDCRIVTELHVSTDFAVDGRDGLASANLFPGLLQRVHQQQADVGMRLTNTAFQRMLGWQR